MQGSRARWGTLSLTVVCCWQCACRTLRGRRSSNSLPASPTSVHTCPRPTMYPPPLSPPSTPSLASEMYNTPTLEHARREPAACMQPRSREPSYCPALSPVGAPLCMLLTRRLLPTLRPSARLFAMSSSAASGGTHSTASSSLVMQLIVNRELLEVRNVLASMWRATALKRPSNPTGHGRSPAGPWGQ